MAKRTTKRQTTHTTQPEAPDTIRVTVKRLNDWQMSLNAAAQDDWDDCHAAMENVRDDINYVLADAPVQLPRDRGMAKLTVPAQKLRDWVAKLQFTANLDYLSDEDELEDLNEAIDHVRDEVREVLDTPATTKKK